MKVRLAAPLPNMIATAVNLTFLWRVLSIVVVDREDGLPIDCHGNTIV
jgi:hypothetical protein